MATTPMNKNTTAFYVQAAIAFGIALFATTVGIWNLPVDHWVRGYLIIANLFLVTTTFTLAKVVRDAQEQTLVVNRIDQARVDRILAEHDPFNALS